MKIKSINNNDNINAIRYNPNTNGTHLLILEGQPNEDKSQIASLAVFTIMYKKGLMPSDSEKSNRELFEMMVSDSTSYIESCENIKRL